MTTPSNSLLFPSGAPVGAVPGNPVVPVNASAQTPEVPRANPPAEHLDASPVALASRPSQVNAGEAPRVVPLAPEENIDGPSTSLYEQLHKRNREISQESPTLWLIDRAMLLIDVGCAEQAVGLLQESIEQTQRPRKPSFLITDDAKQKWEKQWENFEFRNHALQLQLCRAQFASGTTELAMKTASNLLAKIGDDRLGLPAARGRARDRCKVHVHLLMAEMFLVRGEENDAGMAAEQLAQARATIKSQGWKNLWDMEDYDRQGRRTRIGAIGAAVQLEANSERLDPLWRPRDNVEKAVFHALMGDSESALKSVRLLGHQGFFVGSDPAFAKFFRAEHPDHSEWQEYVRLQGWTRDNLIQLCP
jgi:hypothetical protein